MQQRGHIFGMPTNVALPIEFINECRNSWMPVEGIAVVKCLDAQGEPRLLLAATPTLTQWEAVGMLTGALDEVRDEMSKIFVAPEQADEDE